MSNDQIVGESGGIPGLVRIICNRSGQPLKVEIDDLVFKEEDKELVSALFVAALNNMNEKIMEAGIERLKKAVGKQRGVGGLSSLTDLLIGKDGLPDLLPPYTGDDKL